VVIDLFYFDFLVYNRLILTLRGNKSGMLKLRNIPTTAWACQSSLCTCVNAVAYTKLSDCIYVYARARVRACVCVSYHLAEIIYYDMERRTSIVSVKYDV